MTLWLKEGFSGSVRGRKDDASMEQERAKHVTCAFVHVKPDLAGYALSGGSGGETDADSEMPAKFAESTAVRDDRRPLSRCGIQENTAVWLCRRRDYQRMNTCDLVVSRQTISPEIEDLRKARITDGLLELCCLCGSDCFADYDKPDIGAAALEERLCGVEQ